MPKNTYKVGDFTLSRDVIGEGYGGKIIKAHYTPHNIIVAVKMVSLLNEEKKEYFDNETRISHVCKANPNGIVIRKIFRHESHGFIAMDLFDTTLHHLIIQKRRFSPRRAVIYFKQICAGLKYMHKQNIAHLNIAPKNILISTKDSGVFISDYGNSFFLETDQSIGEGLFQLGVRGYDGFQAPEVLVPGSFYNPVQADIWTLGVILLCMLSGYFFDNESVLEEFKSLEGLVPDARELLSKMLIVDPKRRISIVQILEHPFITRFGELERSRSAINRLRKLISR